MHPSIEKLVATLLQGTQNGTIEWEKTSRISEFRTSIKTGSITVDKWDWTHEETGATGTSADISVLNAAGEKIDTCVGIDGTGTDFDKLAQLHETVRRKVLKVDETIESIFKELQAKVTGTHKYQ